MARKTPTHHFNAIYHVMLRGNYRQKIFMKEDHYRLFYQLLDEATQQYDCKIHLFCLMTNHIHMVIEVAQVTLPKVMQKVASTYAWKINKQLKRQGHLFQGRYKSKPVNNERYLLELCSYIHSNPLAAKMVTNLNQYKWSSHQVYNHSQTLTWVTTSHVQRLLEKKMRAGTQSYQMFMQNREDYQEQAEFLDFTDEGQITFRDNSQDKINSRKRVLRQLDLSLQDIIQIVADHMGIAAEELSEENYSRKTSLARSIIAYYAHYHAGYYLKDIAFTLNKHPVSLSRQLHVTLKRRYQEQHLRHLFAALSRQLFGENVSLKAAED